MRVRLIILLLGLSLGLTMRYLFPPEEATSGAQKTKRAAAAAAADRSSPKRAEQQLPKEQTGEVQAAE